MINWVKRAPGIWNAFTGEEEALTPLSFMDRSPKMDGLKRLGERSFPFENIRMHLDRADTGQLIRIPLAEREKVYGMGLQFMRMDQRGRTRHLRVVSDPRQDTGETHAPVPFYVTNQGYGILINTSRIITIYCGSTVRLDEGNTEQIRDRNTDPNWQATPVSDYIEIVLPAGGAELIVFAGESVLEIVQRYNLFCGGGVLPPRWGLGFWHRVPQMYSGDEAIKEAMEFRRRGYPCDVIGLEPGWHSKSYPATYEWSKERFFDPANFVQIMHSEGFHVNLWEHPYISPDAKLYESLKHLSGSHTVWGGLAPDYSLETARALYQAQHKKDHVDIGISGYKLDECDGSELTSHSWMFPAHARFPSGLDGERMRQLYGLMLQHMTESLFRDRDRRTYGLVRASNAGASPLPYVLYSDLYDHRQFVRALCNCCFSGLLWTPEVRAAKSAEDWARRMQTVCFSPLAMLNAWGDGTKPWSYAGVEESVRFYIQLRMRLLPYLYSIFACYYFEGIPPFRAMPLVEAEEGVEQKETHDADLIHNTVETAYGRTSETERDDQYMMGDSLLIAPMFAGEQSRRVFLPKGIWYGLENGHRYIGGTTIVVHAGVDEIPIFVRDGAIIPMMPALAHMPRAGEVVPLDIVHFGTSPGSFHLYDDDGETYAYERGQYEWRELKVTNSADGVFAGSVVSSKESIVSSYGSMKWHFAQTSLPYRRTDASDGN